MGFVSLLRWLKYCLSRDSMRKLPMGSAGNVRNQCKERRQMYQLYTLIFLSFLCLSTGACGRTDSDPPENDFDSDYTPSKPLRILLQEDLASLSSVTSPGFKNYDNGNRNRFSQLFSGDTGPDCKRFFDERIKYTLIEGEFAIGTKSKGMHLRWFSSPLGPISPFAPNNPFAPNKPEPNRPSKPRKPIKPGKPGRPGNPAHPENKKKAQGVTVAYNLGSALWFSGLVEEKTHSVKISGGSAPVPVTSSRVGIMVLGPGYSDQVAYQGQIYPISASSRHASLLHEARHSDCTGGMREADLKAARKARVVEERHELLENKSCMHFHSKCPVGHPFQGLMACDIHPWGAYSVSAIYLDAKSKDHSIPIEEWSELNAQAVDQKSRILLDYQDMIHGHFGEPDMGHRQDIL